MKRLLRCLFPRVTYGTSRRIATAPGGRAGMAAPCVLSLLLTLALPVPSSAQATDAPHAAGPPGPVLSLGAGVGSYGPALVASFGFPAWKGELVLRAGGTGELRDLGEAEAGGDAGVLLGVRRSGERFWARVAAGPGLVAQDSPCDESNVSESCGETRTGLGLLGQVDGVWAFDERFGLGLTLHGALGSGDAGYAAVSLALFFGWGR